ncbi:hypothetical protein CXK93_08540 [Stutzerimonas decontaminans]|uniref:O-antigen/teichoic acid export membrane protein n=2 Tax=Stutzerimonas decontaminans TaxID=3022791 RepID=A0ABX4W3R2_9GAMM|nr:hypothetical protein CXK93_08540 [Stutzerimonas decontaminans]
MELRLPSRFVFQLANIFLMGFQSFVIPLLVGFSEYGKAMLYLAPIYLYQSMFEPVFQGVYGKRLSVIDQSGARIDLDIKVLLLSFIGLMLLAFSLFLFFESAYFVALILCVGFLYLYSTNLQAVLLFGDQYLFVGLSILISVLFYFLPYFYSGLSFEFLIWGNIFYFGMLSVLLTCRLVWLKGGMSFSGRFGLRDFFSHATTRAAYIFSGNGLLIVFGGVGYSAEQIGNFRFSLSLMNAGRYFNPVPLVSLQKSISDLVSGAESVAFLKTLRRFLFFAIFYGVSLFVGWWLYSFIFSNAVSVSYILILTPVYLLIQPASYYLALKGFAMQLFLISVVASLAACAISFYDMWLAFSFMLVSVLFMMVMLVLKIKD